jgi:hypothetical protein
MWFEAFYLPHHHPFQGRHEKMHTCIQKVGLSKYTFFRPTPKNTYVERGLCEPLVSFLKKLLGEVCVMRPCRFRYKCNIRNMRLPHLEIQPRKSRILLLQNLATAESYYFGCFISNHFAHHNMSGVNKVTTKNVAACTTVAYVNPISAGME